MPARIMLAMKSILRSHIAVGLYRCDRKPPDMMSKLGPLGKILGPRGLMPNPKAGTVTQDVAKGCQKEIKAGKIEYCVDKTGNIGAPIGKVPPQPEALLQNAMTFMDAAVKAKTGLS